MFVQYVIVRYCIKRDGILWCGKVKYNVMVREATKKKASFFWTLSTRGLVPPPLILDIREVTFVSAHFGQP